MRGCGDAGLEEGEEGEDWRRGRGLARVARSGADAGADAGAEVQVQVQI